MAVAGETAVMPVIKRISDSPYRWKIEKAPLSRIANKEKMLPRRYISADGFSITAAARRYLQPLIRERIILHISMVYRKYVTLRNSCRTEAAKDKICGMMRRLLRVGPVNGRASRQDSCANKNDLTQDFKH